MLCNWVNVQYAVNMVAFATLAQAAALRLLHAMLLNAAWEQHGSIESSKPEVQVNTNQRLDDTQHHLYVQSYQYPELHRPKTRWDLWCAAVASLYADIPVCEAMQLTREFR